MNSNKYGVIWLSVAALMFLVAVAYTLVMASGDPASEGYDLASLLFGVAGLLALVGWWWDRSRIAKAREKAEKGREQVAAEVQKRETELGGVRDEIRGIRRERDGLRQEKVRLESNLEAREGELERERYLRARSQEAREAERGWTRELQAEVGRMHRELGTLGDPADVPSMVLRLTKRLLGAEKGLLLSREDEDSDGNLDLVSVEGFENDPEESAIVQRFADEVIENDQTIREDEPQKVEEVSTPADEEIQNLVAIPIYIQDEFSGVIVCANREGGFGEYDEDVLLSLGNQAGAVLKNGRLQGELRSSYLATVRVLGEALEAKDPFLRGHSEEVSGYVAAVADRLGVEPLRREQLLFASLLHDVGKIGISERILLKPAALTPEETDIVKLHPRIGHHIV